MTEATWDEWLAENLAQGCDREELLDIMVAKGFAPDDARGRIERSGAGPRGDGPEPVSTNPAGDVGRKPFLPTAITLREGAAELYGVDGFLSDGECARLVGLIRGHLRESTTTEEGVSDFRTSRTCDLAELDDAFVAEIDRRLCAFVGIDPAFGEPLQGQWYDVGQEFKAHTDYFDPHAPDFAARVAERGQRSWTVMVYLNTTRAGGATRFPRLDLDVSPQAGSALLWNNRHADGRPNEATLHHGMPVERGFKVVLTKWFRAPDPGNAFVKEPSEHRAPLTRSGFLKSRTPDALHRRLLEHYRRHRDDAGGESIPAFITTTSGEAPSVLIELPDELRRDVHATLRPVLEAWIGDFLRPTWVYGIREYRRGGTLLAHRDRESTHVASAILNVAQDVDRDWPLMIEDHHYRRHEVCLAPGDMLLYEGARLLHGRPTPLEGRAYANVFAHFRLADETSWQV